MRLGPDDDETEITAIEVRDVITRLIEAGHWHEGDPAILVVFDAGYDVTRLAYLLADCNSTLSDSQSGGERAPIRRSAWLHRSRRRLNSARTNE